jgi:hypothetical protein
MRTAWPVAADMRNDSSNPDLAKKPDGLRCRRRRKADSASACGNCHPRAVVGEVVFEPGPLVVQRRICHPATA